MKLGVLVWFKCDASCQIQSPLFFSLIVDYEYCNEVKFKAEIVYSMYCQLTRWSLINGSVDKLGLFYGFQMFP